jgi:hypothetical protein
MSEVSVNITMSVLQALADRNEDFVLKLSYAAAKEISDKYSPAILKSSIVQEGLHKIEAEIATARKEAGELIGQKFGEWNNSAYGSKYTLRKDVQEYIHNNFSQIIRDEFNEWLKKIDFEKYIDKIVHDCVEKKMTETMKKELGEFLRRW